MEQNSSGISANEWTKENGPKQESMRDLLTSVPGKALRVIRDPAGFYRDMSKDGGFLAPLIFMVVLGLVSGILGTLLSFLGLGNASALVAPVAILLIPIMVGIFGFVAAAIFFLIWKGMGSGENFETAYRCIAYSAAIVPITTLLGLLPYIGTVAGIAWSTWLLVVASREVHAIRPKTAAIVFGAVGILLALGSLSTEIAARKLQQGMEEWQKGLSSKQLEEMTPEEAGKALGDFFKGMDKSLGEKN